MKARFTKFAGMTAAYDALDVATKTRIAPLEAIYTFELLDATLRAQDPTRAPLTPEFIAAHPPHRRPTRWYASIRRRAAIRCAFHRRS